MVELNSETLKKLRAQRRLTLDQLAQRARVDKQTIHRLERGQVRQARGTTVKKLAEALKVDPEQLAEPPSENESVLDWEPNKSQLNLTISNQARNALLLVCERYSVRPAQVVELAPLLFNWAAEKSLRQFDERFEALRGQAAKVSDEIERFNSDHSNLLGGPEAPDPFLEADWDAGMGFIGLFGGAYDEATPIGDFLDELVSELNESSPATPRGGQAEFVGWHAKSSPIYSICEEEATWLAHGDEVALKNILQGYAPLHQAPEDFWEQLRKRNTFPSTDDATRQRRAAERVEWLRAHGKPDDSPEVAT